MLDNTAINCDQDPAHSVAWSRAIKHKIGLRAICNNLLLLGQLLLSGREPRAAPAAPWGKWTGHWDMSGDCGGGSLDISCLSVLKVSAYTKGW